MRRSNAAILLTIFMLTAATAHAAQKETNPPGDGTLTLDGTNVKVLISPRMGVKMTPQRLESSNDTSMLYYTFAVTGNETVYGLRWIVYVGDPNGRLINKDSWWNKGEWHKNSPVEESTVFGYRRTSGSTLVVALQEVVSNTGVRSVGDAEAEQSATEVIAAGRTDLPLQAKFVAHANVSEEEAGALIKRSLDVVLTSNDLKHNLSIKEGERIFILQDDEVNSLNLPGVEPVSNDQIKYKLSGGERVNYLEYCCMETHGRSVRVTLNYHTPKAIGRLFVRRGIAIEFSYSKVQNSFVLKTVETKHF